MVASPPPSPRRPSAERTAPSTTTAVFSVSVVRVPMGVRKRTDTCASSVSGKNSVPMRVKSEVAARKKSSTPATVSARCRSTHSSARA